MSQTAVRASLRQRCDALALSPPAGNARLRVAELATSGLWTCAHAGLIGREERIIGPILDQIARLADLELPHRPLSPVMVGETDPVIDLDHPILCASLELLEESGARSLTLEQVSERANVPLGALHSTFSGPRQLLDDQIAFVADDAATDTLPPGPPSLTAPLADDLLALHDEPRALAKLRLMTLSGLTPHALCSVIDPVPYDLLETAACDQTTALLRVVLLALDAHALWEGGRIALDVQSELIALTGDAITGTGTS